ncbi:MerR family transcriptional regulator [Aridibaculum aurantiacum]|uniref:MerR family transcriptional regulator n=1 Tax=Aridibaculum aurantiacum TaxID=2810307 RepID=UPI001A9794F2|nr:MerR family transcriptional regulator [Aridibaculum aurantiacum]
MNHFTIRDIENLTGIKAHTWRIWEQRYQLCLPDRKESNHRFYDAERLRQILRISYLYHSGVKISKLAKMNDGELSTLAMQENQQGPTTDFYVKELLEAAVLSDDETFEKVSSHVFDTLNTEDAILKVIYPYLERVGVLWITEHLVPAQEHFSSSILRNKIIAAIDSLPPVRNTGKENIVLFTPEKEYHELPLLFIHYLLKKNGKRVTYFGCNIKLKELKHFAENKEVTTFHFHLLTNLTNKDAQEYLSYIASAFPDKSVVISGIQAAQVHNKPANARTLNSMKAILDYARE